MFALTKQTHRQQTAITGLSRTNPKSCRRANVSRDGDDLTSVTDWMAAVAGVSTTRLPLVCTFFFSLKVLSTQFRPPKNRINHQVPPVGPGKWRRMERTHRLQQAATVGPVCPPKKWKEMRENERARAQVW